MKLFKNPILFGLSVVVVVFVVLSGYRVARAERHSAFYNACASGDNERVAFLLRLGADPNGVRDDPYYCRYAWNVFQIDRPLHTAATRGHTAVVRILLAHGADPTPRDSEQSTAQDRARINDHGEIVRLLNTRNE